MIVATSLASSKTASMISSTLLSARSLMESRDSSASLSIFSSQKLILSLISHRQFKILSEFKTSLKLTRNLLPLNCRHCEKRFLNGMHTKARSSQQIFSKSLSFSPNMIAFHRILGVYCFELEVVYQILIKFKNPDRFDRVWKQFLAAAMVLSGMSRASGTLCLLFPGCMPW